MKSGTCQKLYTTNGTDGSLWQRIFEDCAVLHHGQKIFAGVFDQPDIHSGPESCDASRKVVRRSVDRGRDRRGMEPQIDSAVLPTL